MEESESRDRNNPDSTMDFQGRKKQLKATSISNVKKTEENPTKPTKQNKVKPKHTIDGFENHTRSKKVIRKGII